MRTSGLLPAVRWMTAAFLALVAANLSFAGSSARFAGFPESIKNYIEMRHKVESDLPKLSKNASAEQVARYRGQILDALKVARPNARQGDIFTPAVARDFKRALRASTAKKSVKTAIRDGDPSSEGNPARIKLAVNTQYPVDQPISTVPSAVLLKLPELPQELKYCFVGSNLVLLDAESNLIIDYIPKATT